ncbi:hypothetical protein FRC17_006796 [Serendipita sp. 399]|nr:hypothetical protein FRC17_006796 [Serendipita sp. 399]
MRSTRIADLPPSADDLDHDSSPVAPRPLMGAASSFALSMDLMQPSALRSRQRDSFSADKDGWVRSESPSSISPSFGTSPRNIPKSASPEHAASPDPSDSSLFARTIQTPLGVAQSPAGPSVFGIAYQSLIKLSSPADFPSHGFNRNRDPDVSTLYSAASIKSVPVPIRSFTIRSLQQKDQAPRPPLSPSQSQQLRSVLRRSMASAEGIAFGAAISGSQHSPKHNMTLPLDEAEDTARLEYENRDLAADAQPLRPAPDYVIQGTQGIVRSVVLNDRWHALTVDTMGSVGVWDIVRGICVGTYEKGDVETAMGSDCSSKENGGQWKWSPREALDVVRERIEGEAVVHAWCTVDSGIGNLIVHVESGRAFEAEIFADEAGYSGEYTFEEDHRLNIGKWVVGNLFAPFVAQTKMMLTQPEPIAGQATGEAAQSPPGLLRAGIHRQAGHNQLNLEARRIRSISEITATQATPGITSVASILPMTPAIIPAMPADALEKVAAATGASAGTPKDEMLSSLGPLSPAIGSPTPKGRSRSQTVDESSTGHGNDYFSIKRRGSVSGEVSAGKSSPAAGTAVPSQEGGEGTATPSVSLPPSTPAAPVTPLTPGTSLSATSPLKFMGKFKGFGKPRKPGAAEAAEVPQTPAVPNPVEPEKVDDKRETSLSDPSTNNVIAAPGFATVFGCSTD